VPGGRASDPRTGSKRWKRGRWAAAGGDVDARVAIADLIRSVLPSEGFGSSIGDYVRSDAYTFLIAFADDGLQA
jgi:hypothetical protein